MEEAGVTNMSAFIRKMAMDGYVIKLDLTDIKEVLRLVRFIKANVLFASKQNWNSIDAFLYILCIFLKKWICLFQEVWQPLRYLFSCFDNPKKSLELLAYQF